jgi:hypothetical protein
MLLVLVCGVAKVFTVNSVKNSVDLQLEPMFLYLDK